LAAAFYRFYKVVPHRRSKYTQVYHLYPQKFGRESAFIYPPPDENQKIIAAFAVAKRRYLKFAAYELHDVLRLIIFEARKPLDAVKIFWYVAHKFDEILPIDALRKVFFKRDYPLVFVRRTHLALEQDGRHIGGVALAVE
jgi:hypothetical protein